MPVSSHPHNHIRMGLHGPERMEDATSCWTTERADIDVPQIAPVGRLDLTVHLAAPTHLTVQAAAFVPSDSGRGPDTGRLGVALDWLRLGAREQQPAQKRWPEARVSPGVSWRARPRSAPCESAWASVQPPRSATVCAGSERGFRDAPRDDRRGAPPAPPGHVDNGEWR